MGEQVSPVKILYLITDLKFGGAQTVLIQLLKHLDRQKYQPLVACLFGGDSPVGSQLQALNIPVIDLRMSAWWRLDALWRLYQLLRRERALIVHSSLFHANVSARIIGRLAGVPIVITWRQNVSLGSQWREWFNKISAPLDDRVVAVSALTRQAEIQASGVRPDKVAVIHNCIDVDPYARRDPQIASQVREGLGIPSKAFLIGTVGRLHPQKGQHQLLLAFAEIHQEIQEAWLLVVGCGDLRAKLENQAKTLEISKRAVFAGIRTDIPDVLSALDVFVLPSLWEGLPLALLEAMATGLPVVATRVGGNPEVVIHGETGILVPPNDPRALAQAVHTLHDPSPRMRMGQAGKARVREHFSAGQIVPKMEALYAQALREKGIQQDRSASGENKT